MILPFIAGLQCLSAQPWNKDLMYLAASLGYNHPHEIAARSPKYASDPFAEGPLKVSRRLSGLARRPTGCLAKDRLELMDEVDEAARAADQRHPHLRPHLLGRRLRLGVAYVRAFDAVPDHLAVVRMARAVRKGTTRTGTPLPAPQGRLLALRTRSSESGGLPAAASRLLPATASGRRRRERLLAAAIRGAQARALPSLQGYNREVPISRNRPLRMFARWPGLAIQAATIERGVARLP